MTASYNGPLFQLYNGSATLDVGQTPTHTVDLSTWSAFCSGVAANCVYGKLYGQIHATVNDLQPSTIHPGAGPDCTAGPYVCAAPFAVEAATGLPVFITVAPQEYMIGGTDVAATGVTGGNNAISVAYNGQAVHAQYCCAVSPCCYHKYNATNTPGTVFAFYAKFGNVTSDCGSSTTYCAGAALETNDVAGADYGTSLINLIGINNFTPAGNQISANYNGHALYNGVVPNSISMNTGTFMHLGGGGDLSQPSPVYMRESLVANSAFSPLQNGQIVSNMVAFYSALSFP